VLIPTIRKPGSEIWITFNPELEDDETYKRFVTDGGERPRYVGLRGELLDNPWFAGTELDVERLKMLKRDPIGYKTTWEGQCRPAVEGAIYADEIAQAMEAKRIRTFPTTRCSRCIGCGTWAGTTRPRSSARSGRVADCDRGLHQRGSPDAG
jgi:phage terminase large subunit